MSQTLIFQTLNSVKSNNVSLKCQRPTPSGGKDIGIRKFEFVAKTQFLLLFYLPLYSPEFSNVYISIGWFRHVGFHAIDYLDIIFNTIKETLVVLLSEPLYKRGVCPIYKGTLEPFI